jgi:DNA-directed RNA polymerase specialized sigma24 family protein
MVNEALTKLANFNKRKAMIVEYRYFAGFTIEELADVFELSPATVDREWRAARAWLKIEMS